jgi:hypothetical protein
VSRLAIIVCVAVVAGTQVARAEAPCEDCVFVPAESDGRPLVVLMHGDDQSAATIVDAFRDLARERDVALFAPQCPVKLGCDRDSFWRWNGNPKWLFGLVDDLVRTHDLDRRRVWLVGWSGGAGYLGFHLGSLGSRFAAVTFVGGASPGRCTKRKLPIHMISGEDNPHHDLMKLTYAQLRRCGHRVTWKRLPGKDHDDEWRILQQAETQGTIFDFLERHELRRRTR